MKRILAAFVILTFVTITACHSQQPPTTPVYSCPAAPANGTAYTPLNSPANDTGTQTANAPAVTTTIANDIILAGMVNSCGGGNTQTINTPFTAESASTSVNTFGHYLKVSAGSITPSFAFTGSCWWNTGTLALEP